MINNILNTPELCAYCSKPVRTGHPFIVCHECNCIIHKKCTTNNILKFRDATYCKLCCDRKDIVRYNPFYQHSNFNHNEQFDDEPVDYIQSVNTIYNILENCHTYSTKHLNSDILPPSDDQENYLSTFFLNIDGNATNFDSLTLQLSQFKHTFSIIGLAETNTDPENSKLFPLKNYTSCYQDRFFNSDKQNYKGKGSGVCLYMHSSLNFSKLNHLSLCKDSIESLFVEVTNTPEPIIAGVIYRPPNSSLSDFNREYENILTQLTGKIAYILGDFNTNLNSMNSESEQQFEEVIYSNGFTPVISIPTHQMPHCAKTCIDNIHTNDIDFTIVSGVISEKISHHNGIFMLKKLTLGVDTGKNIPPDKLTIHYNYSNANLEKLCDEIENDIDRFFHYCESFESFLALLQEKIDKTCKLLTPKTSKRNFIINPWITEGLINSIEKKARLYFEWRETCTLSLPDGNPDKLECYKEYNKILKLLIKSAKRKLYADKFDKCKGNSKKTWQLINEIRGKTEKATKNDFVIDGQRITCRRMIATKFNHYFTSLAINLNKEALGQDGLSIEPMESFVQYMSKSVDNSIFLECTTAGEIEEIIKSFENGKASDIPIKLVKKSAHLLSPLLAILYNSCMGQGSFPSIFKIGKVTPVYKKDNKESVQNYRPVSILPIFGKIFEKIIYSRLIKFFMANGILHEDQFGFRKGHSTTHALHKSIDIINRSRAEGKHVLGIFIDLSKAFDTLDHDKLVIKLQNSGIRGTALSLLKSYLTQRSQYVAFCKTASDPLEVKYGVPQGSILGPLLFLLYINDITNCYKGDDSKFVLYADDTNIFVTGPSKESTYLKANHVLEQVSKFMKCNLLHINMSKCCYIHFKPTQEYDATCARVRPYADQNDKSRAIFINGHRITKVQHTKFLGVVIDAELSWDHHICYLIKKLRSISGALSRIRHSIPVELYTKIYAALFESHLTYGISVWGVALKDKANDKLFVTQKHCIRIMFGDYDAYLNKLSTCARTRPYGHQKLGTNFYQKEHTKPLFNDLKLLSVQNLFKYYCISEIFKIIKFRCPYPLYDSINVSTRDTSLTIILPDKANTFLYVAAQLWNSIHKKIVKSDCGLETSVSLVKIRAKCLILECQAAEERDKWTDKNFQIASASSARDIPHLTTITHGHSMSLDHNVDTIIDIIH